MFNVILTVVPCVGEKGPALREKETAPVLREQGPLKARQPEIWLRS